MRIRRTVGMKISTSNYGGRYIHQISYRGKGAKLISDALIARQKEANELALGQMSPGVKGLVGIIRCRVPRKSV